MACSAPRTAGATPRVIGSRGVAVLAALISASAACGPGAGAGPADSLVEPAPHDPAPAPEADARSPALASDVDELGSPDVEEDDRAAALIVDEPRNEPADEPETTGESTPAEPARVRPTRTEPARTEPARTEPARTEPARTEPARTEPARTEPARTDDRMLVQAYGGPPDRGLTEITSRGPALRVIGAPTIRRTTPGGLDDAVARAGVPRRLQQLVQQALSTVSVGGDGAEAAPEYRVQLTVELDNEAGRVAGVRGVAASPDDVVGQRIAAAVSRRLVDQRVPVVEGGPARVTVEASAGVGR